MNGYSWVAIISIFCYLFLLLSFASVKKPKKVLRSFIVMLAIMLLWNGGSLGMRMQVWPGPNFWHHVSLLGMIMVAVGYFQFTLDFLDEKAGHGRVFWMIFYIGIFVANAITNFFIPLPEIVQNGGETQFLYHYDWHIYVLLAFIIVTIGQLVIIIWRHCRGNRIAFQQLLPVIGGLLIMLLGHTLATLPMFVGMPVDMLSGAINAFFLFYALYKKKLFRISILLSKLNYALVALLVAVVVFANSTISSSLTALLTAKVGMSSAGALVVVAGVFVVIVAALYVIINSILTGIFKRSEQNQQALLSRFSEDITHMLSMSDILATLSDTIEKMVDVDRLFVLIRDIDGNYYIEHTIKPLEGKNFFLRADHPLVSLLNGHNKCLLMQDFMRKTVYRSMWENEKALLSKLDIDSIVPLSCDGDLIGVVLMASHQNRKGRPACHEGNEWFFDSVAENSATAIKNAYTYEKALTEARKDDLTQLINFKYFHETLEREFELHSSTALSLCLINIDDFKLYNQMYGTHEGDQAMKRVAGILASVVGENGFAARLNSDEFALILPGYDIYSAKCLADNVAAEIATINPDNRKLTVSIGICAAPYMASSAKELYRNADITVYNVKRTGKNAVQMYSAEIYPREAAPSVHKSGYSENASTIYALSAAIDAKDHYTFQHSQNVAHYAATLAKAAGLAPDMIEVVREAGLLHDIGKIGIREDILNKPNKLTFDEYDAVKKHVENAVNIIKYLPELDYVIPAVRSHHERYDGRGYPNGLADENIPLTGRVLCIADAFDAMTSDRVYKAPITPVAAVKILREEAGKQFDPFLVEIFADLVESGEMELKNSPAGE